MLEGMTTPSTALIIDAASAAFAALRLYDLTVATCRPTAERWDEISRLLERAADAMRSANCRADIVHRLRGCAADAGSRAIRERARAARKVRQAIARATFADIPDFDETLPVLPSRLRRAVIDAVCEVVS